MCVLVGWSCFVYTHGCVSKEEPCHSVLLRSDGVAVACGSNHMGQCNIPNLAEGVTYTHADTGADHTCLCCVCYCLFISCRSLLIGTLLCAFCFCGISAFYFIVLCFNRLTSWQTTGRCVCVCSCRLVMFRIYAWLCLEGGAMSLCVAAERWCRRGLRE